MLTCHLKRLLYSIYELSVLTVNVVVIFRCLDYVFSPDLALILAVTEPPLKSGVRLSGFGLGDS
jgi:hypothetical protein